MKTVHLKIGEKKQGNKSNLLYKQSYFPWTETSASKSMSCSGLKLNTERTKKAKNKIQRQQLGKKKWQKDKIINHKKLIFKQTTHNAFIYLSL